MGRRSPYLTKTKAPKYKGNRNISTVTDYTSQDVFYTTESNDTQTRYDYTNKYKDYKDYFTSDIYDSRIFNTYNPKRKGSGESYTFDDYTTSGVSYNEQRKRPKELVFSVSTDDYIHKPSEKYNNISSFRNHNHSYPKGSRPREKKRLRLMKDSDYQEIFDESEQYVDNGRRYRSPRSRYYQDLIHEEPEKEFEYEQYFENAIPKVGSLPKQRKQDKYDDERYEKKNKLQSRTPNKRKEYQVYAYEDPKHHEEVFKGKNHPGDLSLSSEVEIKTHEYPVLAFRDAKSGNKESDMVYLPIIVLDKKSGKSRPEKTTEEPIYQTRNENFQIFAANLQEQQNIFQHFGDLPNITTKEPTSTEKEYTPPPLPPDFGIEATSGMRYADSLLGNIIDEAADTDFKDEDLMNETKEGQRIPFTTGRSPFSYQVDVDILPNEPTGSLKDKDNKSSHIKNSSINDPLHDGYPVTKDYIKVSASEQKRKSLLAPSLSTEKNKLSTVMGQKISEEKKSNTIKEGTRNSSSIKLIDDQTITMSIAKSKATPANKSIMRNPSQEQPLDTEFSSARQSVAMGTKLNSRVSHVGPNSKHEPRASKLSPLNEEASQEVIRKSIKTGTTQPQSAVASGKITALGIAENTASGETRRTLYGSDRKSIKPNMHTEQSTDGQSSWKPSSPDSQHRKSVLHSQDRKSTVAHMTAVTTPSSHNMRASHAPSRKSAEEDRKSKVQTTPYPISDHQQSVLHSQQSQGRKSTVAQKSEPHSMAEQHTRESQAQSRRSAVSSKHSAANLHRNDGQTKTKASAREQSQKTVPESLGKKSLVQSQAHQSTNVAAEKTGKVSHKADVEDDSAEALAQFTKDVFQLDLAPQEKTQTRKSEQKKSSVSKGRLQATGPGQSLNVVENVEPSHEVIGDNSAGIGKTQTEEEHRKKPSSLMRTTSKIFTNLSKLGKKKSTVQSKPYIPTGSPTGSIKSEEREKPATTTKGKDDSQFVHSIEPTVTQYKNEQNRTQTITKSKSELDNQAPKEKKSLTRLFSRTKSKSRNESGDEKKKTKKSKSRSLLGILKRSKSSELAVAPPPKDKELGERPEEKGRQAGECECFAHYIQNTRVCAYFFLGTTLHDQIMNIIKMFLGGN